MIVNNMINNIGKNLARMDKYQQMLATGKKITVPSDDPVVAARALKLRTDVAQIEQYKTNVQDAMSWLEITESAVANVGDICKGEGTGCAGKQWYHHRGGYKENKAGSGAAEKPADKNCEFHICRKIHISGFKTNTRLMDDDGYFTMDVANSEAIIIR